MPDSKNSKISELPELTTATTSDVLPIVDVSTAETKKITINNLKDATNEALTAVVNSKANKVDSNLSGTTRAYVIVGDENSDSLTLRSDPEAPNEVDGGSQLELYSQDNSTVPSQVYIKGRYHTIQTLDGTNVLVVNAESSTNLDGTVTLPQATNAKITTAGSKAITTKEFVDSATANIAVNAAAISTNASNIATKAPKANAVLTGDTKADKLIGNEANDSLQLLSDPEAPDGTNGGSQIELYSQDFSSTPSQVYHKGRYHTFQSLSGTDVLIVNGEPSSNLDGTVTLPNATNAKITTAGAKAVATKEYVDATSSATGVAQNTANIATNTANIATNTANIATKAPKANAVLTGDTKADAIIGNEANDSLQLKSDPEAPDGSNGGSQIELYSQDFNSTPSQVYHKGRYHTFQSLGGTDILVINGEPTSNVDGTITLPNATNAKIGTAGAKAVVTKEYADTKANASTVSSLTTSVTSNTTNIASNYNSIVTINSDLNAQGALITANTSSIGTKAPKHNAVLTGNTRADKIIGNEANNSLMLLADPESPDGTNGGSQIELYSQDFSAVPSQIYHKARYHTFQNLTGNTNALIVNSDGNEVEVSKLVTNEIQCKGGAHSGTAQPITYDSKEHRFRDYDETPNNLMVIKKTDGQNVGKVGINQSNPKSALHVVGGHSSGVTGEAMRVIGGAFFDDWVRVGHYTDATRNQISEPTAGTIIYNTTHNEFQGRTNSGWVKFNTSAVST